MNQSRNEYAATTMPCPGYSNLPQYGAGGCIKGIQAPTPMSIIPAIFRTGFRPHGIPAPHAVGTSHSQYGSHVAKNHRHAHSHTVANPEGCGQYRQMKRMC